MRQVVVRNSDVYRYCAAALAALCISSGTLLAVGGLSAVAITSLWVGSGIIGLKWSPPIPRGLGVRRRAPTWRGVLWLVCGSTAVASYADGGMKLLSAVVWYISSGTVFAYTVAKAGCVARGCCSAVIATQRQLDLAQTEMGLSVIALVGADVFIACGVKTAYAASGLLISHAAIRALSSARRTLSLSFSRAFIGEGAAPVALAVLSCVGSVAS